MNPVRLAFLALGAALGSYLPFAVLIQTEKGFDPIAIGLIGAAGGTLAILGAPVWGHLGDVTLGRRRVLQLASVAGAVLLVLYGLVDLPLAGAGLWLMAGLFISTLNPTVDAVGVVVTEGGSRSSFARLRVLLSLGFGVITIGVGVLYSALGYGAAPFVAGAAFIVVALAATRLADPRRDAAAGASAGRRGGSAAAAFAAQPRLPFVLLTFALGMMGMITVFGWLPLRLAELGGDPSVVALAAGLEALAEVPAFLVAGFVAARIGPRATYLVSATVMGLCVIGIALLADPALMVALRAVNGVAYAGMTVASVLALGRLLPASLQSTAQSLSAMMGGVVSIALGVAGGAIYQLAGGPALFAVTGALTLIGALLAVLTLPGRERRPAPLSAGASSG